MILGHKRGVNACGDLLDALRVDDALTNGQQLDDVARSLSSFNVFRRDVRNALAVNIVVRHSSVERQGCQDRSLRRGVMPLNVRSGIGLGVA